MLKINDRTRNLLDSEIIKYPHLHQYITHFIKNDGKSEDKDFLPKLIVWIRNINDDTPSGFTMDDDTYLEFCSWGHNSRWQNVFWDYLTSNLDYAIGVCLDLAREHGDCRVEYSEE